MQPASIFLNIQLSNSRAEEPGPLQTCEAVYYGFLGAIVIRSVL